MKALGLIESVGMTTAVTAADAAVKSANVTLLGYELTKGGGMVTITFEGDVGAVKAAVEAASAAAERVGRVVSKHIIPRPHEELGKVIFKEEKSALADSLIKKKENTLPKKEGQRSTAETTGNAQEEKNKEVGSPQENPESEPGFSSVSDEDGSQKADERGEGLPEITEVCNICNDPVCPRKKGELKVNCIHYKEIRRNAQ